MKQTITLTLQGDNFEAFKDALEVASRGILQGQKLGFEYPESSSFHFVVTEREEEGNDKDNFYWDGES